MQDMSLYRLMTWLSPPFPVGSYAYSHGLEYATSTGIVKDFSGLQRWVGDILQNGFGRIDALLFCAAYRAVKRGDAANFTKVSELSATMRTTSELAAESMVQGQAFLRTIRSVWPSLALRDLATLLKQRAIEPTYPISVSMVCALADIPLNSGLVAYLQSLAGNLVSAGIRLIPLGQTDGQRVMAELEKTVLASAQIGQKSCIENIGSATPMADWTSMQHETQRTRLFRS